MVKFGDYEYNPNNIIGQGTFACVYKGKNRLNNNDVILKIMKSNDNEKKFEREIKILNIFKNIMLIKEVE